MFENCFINFTLDFDVSTFTSNYLFIRTMIVPYKISSLLLSINNIIQAYQLKNNVCITSITIYIYGKELLKLIGIFFLLILVLLKFYMKIMIKLIGIHFLKILMLLNIYLKIRIKSNINNYHIILKFLLKISGRISMINALIAPTQNAIIKIGINFIILRQLFHLVEVVK